MIVVGGGVSENMGDKAARICEAKFGLLWICRDGRFQVAEIHPHAASSFNSYLTVATARQHMASTTADPKSLGDGVAIRIRDNGTGIPTDVTEKMFNASFTTKSTGEDGSQSAAASSSSNMQT